MREKSESLESLIREHNGLEALVANRIVGGTPTPIEEVPWIISLRVYGSHRCGGAIISERHILSAAHCTAGLSASAFEIRAGSTNNGSGGILKSIARFINHPLYSSQTLRNDISII